MIPVIIIVGLWFAYSYYALEKVRYAHNTDDARFNETVESLIAGNLAENREVAEVMVTEGMKVSFMQALFTYPHRALFIVPYHYFLDTTFKGVKY